MKRGRQGGYTIVEVMIVLAVTAGLFVATAAMLSGKQSRTQFEQGVHDFANKLQTAMSDVNAGYFSNGFKCDANAAGVPKVYPSTAALGGPGSNTGCIFLGKVLYRESAASIKLIDVVGRQYVDGSNPKTESIDMATALPNTDLSAMEKDLTIQYGISLVKISNLRPGGGALTGIAFYNDLGGSSQSDPSVGRQSVHLYGLKGTPASTAITDVSSVGSSNYLDLPNGVVLCLADGAQNAEITIGASGGGNNISSSIGTSGVGACG